MATKGYMTRKTRREALAGIALRAVQRGTAAMAWENREGLPLVFHAGHLHHVARLRGDETQNAGAPQGQRPDNIPAQASGLGSSFHRTIEG